MNRVDANHFFRSPAMNWQQTNCVDAGHFFQSDDERAHDDLDLQGIDGLEVLHNRARDHDGLERVNEHERDLDGLNGMNEISKASTSKKSTASKSVYGVNEFPMAPTSK